MRIGIFADAHDHVDNIRRTVAEFNRLGCDLVIFAGDFASPIAVPPLRKLQCPLIACFGDSDGNKTGIRGGLRVVGEVWEPPFGVQAPDGTRILVTHVPETIRGQVGETDVVIFAHSHRAAIERDKSGRLLINPGETGGWTYRKPTIAVLETEPREARLIRLPEMPPVDVESREPRVQSPEK